MTKHLRRSLSRNLRTLEQAGLIEIATVESDLRRRAANGKLAERLSPDLARRQAEEADGL